jgi:sulfate adenylyltransferase
MRTARPLTLLDGDVVRKTLWPELGFSKEDRDTNIRRLGELAAEITKGGGIAICASIAPYARVRAEVRALIAPLGGFVLVHMATPLDICERRDPKGLYARARAGLLREFTGISDPYEVPDDAEVVLDASHGTPEDAARRIVEYLERERYLESTRP